MACNEVKLSVSDLTSRSTLRSSEGKEGGDAIEKSAGAVQSYHSPHTRLIVLWYATRRYLTARINELDVMRYDTFVPGIARWYNMAIANNTITAIFKQEIYIAHVPQIFHRKLYFGQI